MSSFMDPILDALNDGSVIRKGVKALVQITAVIMVLATLLLVITLLKASFQVGSSLATVGGLLLALFLIVACVCSAQVFLYRARTIDALGASPFTVVPIVAILIRLAGEFWAINMMAFAVGGCLAAWLGGPLVGVLGELSGARGMHVSGSFLGGLVVFGYSFVLAALSLISAYFLAEILVVTVDMARSLRTLVEAGGATSSARPTVRPAPVPQRPAPTVPPVLKPKPAPAGSPDPSVQTASAAVSRAAPAARHCAACGHAVEPDAAFCGECGGRL